MKDCSGIQRVFSILILPLALSACEIKSVDIRSKGIAPTGSAREIARAPACDCANPTNAVAVSKNVLDALKLFAPVWIGPRLNAQSASAFTLTEDEWNAIYDRLNTAGLFTCPRSCATLLSGISLFGLIKPATSTSVGGIDPASVTVTIEVPGRQITYVLEKIGAMYSVVEIVSLANGKLDILL
jgi:hypothetical protein